MSADYSDRLRKQDWEVKTVSLEVARSIVVRFHYAKGSSNTAVYRHGLFQKGSFWDDDCKGVAIWIPPTKSAAQAIYPENWQGVLSLSRLAISPEVPKNGCSFLISKSIKLIDRNSWPCLVTYADSWKGHKGTIYKASNWTCAGMTKPEPTYTINGALVARKAGPKTRNYAEMIAIGANLEGSHAKVRFVLK